MKSIVSVDDGEAVPRASASASALAIFSLINLSCRCLRNLRKIKAFNEASESLERILVQYHVAAEKTRSTSVDVGLMVMRASLVIP